MQVNWFIQQKTPWLSGTADVFSWILYHLSISLLSSHNHTLHLFCWFIMANRHRCHKNDHLREQNMIEALNIIAVKYMHWVSGKILRTLMDSSAYIQPNKHHLSKYFLLWESNRTANCHFRTTFALQSSTSETHSGLMSIHLFIKRIKTYGECGSPYAYCTFTTAWQILIKFCVNIYPWSLAKVLLRSLWCSNSYSSYSSTVTILIYDQLTQARSKPWLLVRERVLVVRSLMSRSRLLLNRWLYSMCHINCSVPSAHRLPNACLSGLELQILCNGATARDWPVNDQQWHDWCKYSYTLSISVCVCVYTASQFSWLQCSLCNGTNVDASLPPALKPPDPAQGCFTMQVAHLLVSEVLFALKLKHGVGKLPHYF